MFELILSSGNKSNVIPYLGEIGVYNLMYTNGPTKDELYLAAGVTAEEKAGRGLFLWNAKEDTYTNLGTLPTVVHTNSAMGQVDNKVYFIFGSDINFYDATKKSWGTRAGPAYGSPFNFIYQGSVTYNGYMYFFGPSSSPEGLTLKRYNHNDNTWLTEATYTTTTNNGTYNKGIQIGNVAYFFGLGNMSKTIVKYNFTTKVFTTITSPVAISYKPAICLYGSKIIFTPVDEAGDPVDSFSGKSIMMLDTTNDQISKAAVTDPVKATAAGVVIGNVLKAYGGQDKTTSKPTPGVQSIVVGPPVDVTNPVTILSTTPITSTTQPIRQTIWTTDSATNRIWIHRGVKSDAQWNTWLGYYDVTTGAWVPRYNWTATPPLAGGMTVLDNKVYYFKDNSIWVYDNTTSAFTTKPAPGGAVFAPYSVPAFTYKNNIYQMGTIYVSGAPYCQVVRYNPVDNTRTLFLSAPGVQDHGSANGVLVGEWYCICGSSNSGGVASQVYCFNMESGAFKIITLRITVDASPALVSDGKTFSILGGVNTPSGIWTVDPNTGYSWQTGVTNPVKQRGAAIINDDIVTYYGGATASLTTSSATIITFKYPYP